MRSDQAASKVFSGMLWSMLMLSLFAAPALMAARANDPAGDRHTAELIRLHQQALSPLSSAPQAGDHALGAGSCERSDEDAAATVDDANPSVLEATPDQPMIRLVGNRAKRIKA